MQNQSSHDYLSVVLSALALLGTSYTYFVHNRKLKKQELQLNQYKIQKNQAEEIERKRADIRGNVISSSGGARVLKIFNKGKSVAYNVRVEYLDGCDAIIIHDDDVFPIEALEPYQNGADLYLHLSNSSPRAIKLKFIWNDEFQDNNEYVQVLQIN